MLILGQKVKGQIWTLNFFTVSAPQLHLLWTTIIILHKCIYLDLKRTSIDLGSKDQRTKSYLVFKTLYQFNMIHPFIFGIQ